ncbi:hypothetical protein FOZ76_24620 [Verticiella sediminum]|uniref:Aldehyde dehydrogenase family protein n=1 Tax=Verticiella sediminum TaxID=1247510 RepID=A0A556A7F8_9BURK|nr:hypothetical protein [Verticiella sediminum]TSH88826.1 hypothetical protein FOZ76_24620 [Verticiella sediminum]
MQTELVIDNIPRAAENGATFERRHPVSGELVSTGAAASVADALAAAESAAKAFASWSATGPSTGVRSSTSSPRSSGSR